MAVIGAPAAAQASSVTATIPLPDGNGGTAQPWGIALSPDGSTLYATDPASSRVIVIDATTHAVTGSIPVGSDPREVLFTPDGTKAYVLNYGGAVPTLSVIDVATGVQASLLIFNGTGYAQGMAISPDGSQVYVPTGSLSLGGGPTAGVLKVVQVSNNAVSNIVLPQLRPVAAAFTPNGATALIAFDNGTAEAFDTATRALVPPVISGVGDGQGGITISPDGKTAYFTSSSTDKVNAVSLATNAVTSSIGVGEEPQQSVFSPDGTLAYSVNSDSNTVSVIDVATGKVVETIPVGDNPKSLAISSDGKRLFVSNAFDPSISVISLSAATSTPTSPSTTTPTKPSLALTGSSLDVPLVSWSAAAAVAAGLLMLLIRRRRRGRGEAEVCGTKVRLER